MADQNQTVDRCRYTHQDEIDRILIRMHAAIRQLDPDGGWDHETTGGWPDMETYYGLRDASDQGYVQRSTAYDVECWRLTEEGIALRGELS